MGWIGNRTDNYRDGLYNSKNIYFHNVRGEFAVRRLRSVSLSRRSLKSVRTPFEYFFSRVTVVPRETGNWLDAEKVERFLHLSRGRPFASIISFLLNYSENVIMPLARTLFVFGYSNDYDLDVTRSSPDSLHSCSFFLKFPSPPRIVKRLKIFYLPTNTYHNSCFQ